MTEEQKRELEKQANYYSHDFFERLKNGLDTEIYHHVNIDKDLRITIR